MEAIVGLFGSIITLIGVLGSIVGIYEFSRKIIPPYVNTKYSAKRVQAILEVFVSQLVEIPQGTFLMGSDKLFLKEEDSLPDEYPKHQVNITHGVLVSKYPVNQELWEAVMGTGYRVRYRQYYGLTKPIINVS